jgi:hypothetical protein
VYSLLIERDRSFGGLTIDFAEQIREKQFLGGKAGWKARANTEILAVPE